MTPKSAIYDVQIEYPRLVLRPTPPPPGGFDGSVWNLELGPAEQATLYLIAPDGQRPSVTIAGRRSTDVVWRPCEGGKFCLVLPGIPEKKKEVDYKLSIPKDGEVCATTVRITPPGKGDDLGIPR